MFLSIVTKFSCWIVGRTVAVASDKILVFHYHRLNKEFKSAAHNSRIQRGIFAAQTEVAKELWKRGLYPPLAQANTETAVVSPMDARGRLSHPNQSGRKQLRS
jgi:hypothetical protein